MFADRTLSRCGAKRAPLAGRGFSLVELLVVIGIIAALIGILVPVINKARMSANTLKCVAQLQQIGTASMMHANEHRGYIPMAGHINTPGTCTPAGMNDSSQLKYSYYNDGGVPRPMPYPGAVAKYMGFKVNTESQAGLYADLTRPDGVGRLFTCPTQDAMQSPGSTIAESTHLWIFPRMVLGYVFNEGLLGYPSAINARRMGHILKVKYASQVAIMADGRANQFDAQLWWTNADVNVTLADAYNGTGLAGERLNFDLTRHQGKMNVLFVDGHAATILISKQNGKATPEMAATLIQPPR